MVAGNAGGDAVDLAVGHQFGFIHSLLDGLGGGIDIGHHAGFEAARRCLPQADDMDFVVFLHFAYQGNHFGSADVQRADVFAFYHDVPFIFCLLLIVIGG